MGGRLRRGMRVRVGGGVRREDCIKRWDCCIWLREGLYTREGRRLCKSFRALIVSEQR